MKKFFTLLCCTALVACVCTTARADHFSDRMLFTARMDGGQEVPTVLTPAVGVAAVWLNGTRDTMCITVSWRNLTDSLTGIHVHRGPVNVAGPIVISLSAFVQGNQAIATIAGAMLTDSLIHDLIMGRLYVNAHSVTYPSGEIRGQLIPESDHGLVAMLGGLGAMPMNPALPSGLASFRLSKSHQRMTFKIAVTGATTGLDSAQLLLGPLDSLGNGVVVEELSGMMQGRNFLMGTLTPTAYVSDLLSNNVFVRVSGMDFTNGYMVGRLTTDTMMAFGALLNAEQETPPVPSDAVGVGVVRVTGAMDTLRYDVLVVNLSGPITAAHFHDAPEGVPGPPVIDITPDIQSNYIGGMLTGAAVTPQHVSKLLRGEYYLNVHTDSFPNGEARGQVYKKLREAYTFMLESGQVVPPVQNDTAYGSGIVSISTDTADLHFVALYNGLTDTLTQASFFSGTAGQSGSNFMNVYPWFNSGYAEAFWSISDPGAPFTSGFAQMFTADSVYVGLSTGLQPGGALRGQVRAASACDLLTDTATGVMADYDDYDFSVYPNPASHQAVVRLHADENGTARLTIVDVTGRSVRVETVHVKTGVNAWTLDLDGLSRGLYRVQLQRDRHMASQPLVIE